MIYLVSRCSPCKKFIDRSYCKHQNIRITTKFLLHSLSYCLEQSLNNFNMKASIFAVISALMLAAAAAPSKGQNAESAVPDCVSTQSCADGIHAPADKRAPPIPGFDPESIRKTLESPPAQD